MQQYSQYINNLDKKCGDKFIYAEWNHKSFEQESKKKTDRDIGGKKDTKK